VKKTKPRTAVDTREHIRLRCYRHAVRKPSMTIDDQSIHLYLPAYFGKLIWSLPLDQTAVLRPISNNTSGSQSTDSDLMFFTEPIIVPYFYTTGPATKPSLTLFFRSSQRVPPLQSVFLETSEMIPFSRKMSRSAEGVWVTGLKLRMVDTIRAHTFLARAGAESIVSESIWLKQNRPVVKDPADLAVAHKQSRLHLVLDRVRLGLMVVGVLALWASAKRVEIVVTATVVLVFSIWGFIPLAEFLLRRKSRP
jgi:hypothetical protein